MKDYNRLRDFVSDFRTCESPLDRATNYGQESLVGLGMRMTQGNRVDTRSDTGDKS